MAQVLVMAVAAVFAVVTGANDGGALLTSGLKLRGLRTASALAVLGTFVVVTPLVFGDRVAQTFVTRLVTSPSGARLPLLLGIGAAVAVVAVLTRAGLPTSLTLAIIGGITGAGLGAGLPVSITAGVVVLGVGLAAPLVGAAVGFLLTRLTRIAPRRRSVGRSLSRMHRLAFATQCLAYGANDGQKMIAVLLIAAGTGATSASPGIGGLLMLAAFFMLGTVLGLPRVAGSLGDKLLPVRPVNALSAEFAGAISVLGSAAVGVPVSMTQSLAGGLIGSGVGHGIGRVRWRAAGRIGTAWAVTLPASVVVAGAVTLLIELILR